MLSLIFAAAIACCTKTVNLTTQIIATSVPTYIIEEECSMVIKKDDRFYYICQEDIDLICRCVMSETGSESDDCQQAAAIVILNRYFSPNYPNEFSEIIIPGQFSTTDNGEVTDQVRYNVQMAMYNYGTFYQIVPYTCYYFRANHYHNFGIPYRCIDNTYFSLSDKATD